MDTSLNIKELVIVKYKEGLKQKQICDHLNLHKSVVCRIIQKYRKTGSVQSQRPGRCGRHLSLSAKEMSKIKRQSIKDPKATAREIQAGVGGKCLDLSVRSMRRYLLRTGRLSFRPIHSPSLNAKQMRNRKRWARSKSHWTDADWRNVTFSDETAIELSSGSRNKYVRRSKNERWTMKHTKTHKAFKRRLLIWSCIQASGPGPLVIMRGTLDAQKYLDILNEHIIPFPEEVGTFQQDNAPPHKAAAVLNAMKDAKIPLLDWPPYSPDLNCIENMWSLLKDKVAKRSAQTLSELETVIRDIWENDSELKQTCKSLFSSMRRRVRSCIRSRGGVVQY